MKAMENRFSLWSNVFMLLAGSVLTPAEAAMTNKPQVAHVSLPQKLLYKVNSDTLEGLKESLIQVNLHMRQNANRIRPKVRIALSGKGIVWLQKNRIDAELKNMLEWFQDEDVQIGLDQYWVRQVDLQVEDLEMSFEILHFHSSTPKEE